jgi:signal transduction histidine kinase/ActR/RegA family two-component response regulator
MSRKPPYPPETQSTLGAFLARLIRQKPVVVQSVRTDRQGINLLLVCEDLAFCDALQRTWGDREDKRYQVMVANSPREAREKVLHATQPFDVLLIDQKLKGEGGDGTHLTTELLKLSPDSAAILLTEFSSPEDGLRALQAGADDYLIKTSDWQTTFRELALRVAVLFENKEARRRRVQELESLVEIQSAIIGIESEADLPKVLDSIVQFAMQYLSHVDAITIFYINPETGEPQFGGAAGILDLQQLKTHPPKLRRVLSLTEPYYAFNAAEDLFVHGEFVTREKIVSVAVFPLINRGERFGLMFFNYRHPQAFDENEKSELNLFAQQAALAIHKVVIFDETRRRQQRFETIARIMPIVGATLDPEQVVRTVSREILKVVPRAREVCMLYYEQDTGDLVFSLASFEFYHIDVVGQLGRTRLKANEPSTPMSVVRSGKGLYVPDVSKHPAYQALVSSTQAQMCMPIQVGGEILGVLVLESNQLDAFTLDDQFLLQALADQVAVALKKAQEHTRWLKAQDDLAANDAIAWMGLFGSNWSHTVNQRTFEIEGKVFLLRQALAGMASPEIEKWLSDIEDASRQLKALQIAGKVSHEPRPGDSTVSIDRVLTERVPRWCEKFPEVTLTMDLQCPGVHVPIEEGWLEIPLEKLINNALKAMGGKGALNVRSVRYGNRVEVQVQDTGKGIPEEAKKYLFKRPVPKPTSKEGSGLGLLIARKVLTAHGGDLVLLRTAPGEGTTFMFHLPVAHLDDQGA